jgi:hypothetical protein
MIVKRPVNEDIENKLNSYKDTFLELKQEISEIRREGKDTSIIELLVYEVEPLIKMARATYEDRDIVKVGAKLDEIRNEMTVAKEGEPFVKMQALIQKAFAFLRDDKRDEAAKLWAEIQGIYTTLPKDLQKTVYKACLELHKRVG